MNMAMLWVSVSGFLRTARRSTEHMAGLRHVVRLWRFARPIGNDLAARARLYHAEAGSSWRTAVYICKYFRVHQRRFMRRRSILRSAAAFAADIAPSLAVDDPNPAIAVLVTGGIGDYIVVARFLRDLAAAIEPVRFDVYCARPEAGDWVFASIPGFRRCYCELLFQADSVISLYPLAMRVSQFVIVDAEKANWRRLREFRRLAQAADRIMHFRGKIDLFVQRHPTLDGYLAQKAVYANRTRENFLHAIAGIAYGGPRLELSADASILADIGLGDCPYVTINNGFDAEFIVTRKLATKCYPHCDELVGLFRGAFPGVTVVQIGASTSTSIAGADVNLVDKTSLAETAALVKHAGLHIDNEGGLVHIAQACGTRCCVIFGPTSLPYFAYPDNINISPTFCGGCWWTNETWMDMCPRGFATARCMSEQKPAAIISQIAQAWRPMSPGAQSPLPPSLPRAPHESGASAPEGAGNPCAKRA